MDRITISGSIQGLTITTLTATRIDHSFSDKHRLMGRFSWDNWYESAPDTYYNGTTGDDQYRKSYVGALDDVYVFSPTVVLDVKLGVTYQPYNEGPPNSSFNYTALGFAPQMTALIPNATAIFPSINFNDPLVSSNIGAGGGYYNNNTNETIAGTLSWQKGKHSIRIGAEGRMWSQNYMNTYNNTSPSISFGGYTNGPDSELPRISTRPGLLAVPAGYTEQLQHGYFEPLQRAVQLRSNVRPGQLEGHS